MLYCKHGSRETINDKINSDKVKAIDKKALFLMKQKVEVLLGSHDNRWYEHAA